MPVKIQLLFYVISGKLHKNQGEKKMFGSGGTEKTSEGG